MTWDYLERHLVTLTTIGPVSIASGRELSKKEYILDRKRQEAVILDERKLFSYLKRRGLLESFERYMLGGRGDLFHWAREERVYPEDAGQIEKYRLDCSAITEINTVKNMMTFMKDAYGLPYVPGSSIKGALRNVILARMIEEEPDRELAETIRNTVSDRSIRGGKQLLRRESRDLEAGYLYTLDRLPDRPRSVLNDRMAGVRVADSPALSTDCLTLCQKIDEDTGAACRPLPIVRECLKPGTVIRAVLTLDRSLTDLSIESIREAIRSFNERYNGNI